MKPTIVNEKTAEANDVPSHTDLAARTLVWLVWASMLLTGLVLASQHGVPDIPWQDEFAWIPQLTGEAPLTVSWLWEQHAEHRFAAGKLLWYLLIRLGGGDLRVVLCANVLILAALAAALVETARRMRGWMNYTDAFLPLLVMNYSNWHLYLFSAVLVHVVNAGVVVLLLMSIVRTKSALALRPAILAGGCLVLLPLFGGSGLPYVPMLGLWLAYAAFVAWRMPGAAGKRWAAALVCLAITAMLILAISRTGLGRVENPPNPGARESVETALKVLSTGLGPRADWAWKYSGPAALLFGLLTAIAIVVRAHRESHFRLQGTGLFLFLGVQLILAVGIAWARTGYGGGLDPHYSLFTAPGMACAYFAWELATRRAVSRFFQVLLLTTASVSLWQNVSTGHSSAVFMRQHMAAIERDLSDGVPPFVLAERHMWFLFPWRRETEYVAQNLRMLQRAGYGRFRHIPPDPLYEEHPLAMDRKNLEQIGGPGASETRFIWPFSLTNSEMVYGIRLKHHSTSPDDLVTVRVRWTLAEGGERREEDTLVFDASAGQRVATFWVNNRIDGFHVESESKGFLDAISQTTLVVPQGKTQKRHRSGPSP